MAEALILASSSPRRRQLLTQAGIPFEVDAPQVDEVCFLPAGDTVAEVSRRKALASAALHPGRFILAADTLVALDGRKLGKPRDIEEAVQMLRQLSGRTNQVFTGVTVVRPNAVVKTELDVSEVTFDQLTEEEIQAYAATGEPLDKAGAYGVQGRAALFVSHLNGCYFGVMGLPLYLVRRMLKEAGFFP